MTLVRILSVFYFTLQIPIKADKKYTHVHPKNKKNFYLRSD